MMKKIKQMLNDYMYSCGSPEGLAHWYFAKKDAKDRAKLNRFFARKKDLMDAVTPEARDHWEIRIQRVLDSADNASIPRHARAGEIIDGQLIMHNGNRVDPLGYYSFPLLKMLVQNKGVHEPQEEKIFQEVLKTLDAEKKLTMLELGAYWSFYSMWLLSVFPNSCCVMVEPDRKNLMYGKRNFKTNGFQGTFVHAGIGKDIIRQANNTTVDAICAEQRLEFVDILHSDIQGYELQMLHGATQLFAEKRVGYVFISTHSNELHANCRQFLIDLHFTEVSSVDLDESSSWDGILVMKAPHYKGIEKVKVTKGVSAR